MPSINSRARREQRKVEAKERQASWDALSDTEKLEKLTARGFTTGKEVAKITKRIDSNS